MKPYLDLLYQWSTLTNGQFPARSTRSCTMRSQRSSDTRSGKLCLVATWIVVPPHFQPTPPHQCPLSQPRDQGGFLIANRKNVFQRITTPTLFFSTACALVLITVSGVFIHPVTQSPIHPTFHSEAHPPIPKALLPSLTIHIGIYLLLFKQLE